jgi:hypothetical protein
VWVKIADMSDKKYEYSRIIEDAQGNVTYEIAGDNQTRQAPIHRLVDFLNEQSAEGWDLVSVVPHGGSSVYVMKRKVRQKSEDRVRMRSIPGV